MPTARPRSGGRSWRSCRTARRSSPKRSWSTIRWFIRDCASTRPALASTTTRWIAANLLATAERRQGHARFTLQMNQPVALDANTTVTLAEYIPDFFVRDNQVFKKSDDPENPGVPAGSEEQRHRRRSPRSGCSPRKAAVLGGENPNYQFKNPPQRRHADGLLHRPGSFA